MTQLLLRNYEGDLDGLTKQQKQAVEKAELSQALDMRNSSKKLHQEQVQLQSVLRGRGHCPYLRVEMCSQRSQCHVVLLCMNIKLMVCVRAWKSQAQEICYCG